MLSHSRRCRCDVDSPDFSDEEIVTSKEYQEALLALLGRFPDLHLITGMNQRTDRLWQKWLDVVAAPTMDLFLGNTQAPFRARAIVASLVPSRRLLPFAWKGVAGAWESARFVDRYTHHDPESHGRRRLFSELADFIPLIAEFVWISCAYVRPLKRSTRRQKLLQMYNRIILNLLKVLSPDVRLADLLCGVYELREPFPSRQDKQNPLAAYEPFRDLLGAEDIPSVWKWRADGLMRDKILQNGVELHAPLDEAMFTARCYADIVSCRVNRWSSSLKSKVTRQMLVDQVEFLLHLCDVREMDLFPVWVVDDMLTLLAGEPYRALRHRFIRHVVLHQQTKAFRFGADGDIDVAVAKRILRCRPKDLDVVHALQNKMELASRLRKKVSADSQWYTQQHDRLIEQMRRSS